LVDKERRILELMSTLMSLEVEQGLCSSALIPSLVEELQKESSLPSFASARARREEEDR